MKQGDTDDDTDTDDANAQKKNIYTAAVDVPTAL